MSIHTGGPRICGYSIRGFSYPWFTAARKKKLGKLMKQTVHKIQNARQAERAVTR